ncbi:hypothetical protein [Candidatus Palauibacter sp.]|uniref:hypothetical protein n=1 Tax=Candidatus Palauibacter sp. TaxID=3101350 RepID=UPI003B011276
MAIERLMKMLIEANREGRQIPEEELATAAVEEMVVARADMGFKAGLSAAAGVQQLADAGKWKPDAQAGAAGLKFIEAKRQQHLAKVRDDLAASQARSALNQKADADA